MNGNRGPTVLVTGLMVLVIQFSLGSSDDVFVFNNFNEDSNRLRPPATYFITAPNTVRPNQLLQVFVSVFRITYPHLLVTAAVRQGVREVCSVTQRFLPGSSSLMQMQMPADALPGNYTFRVQGRINEYSQGKIFENETEVFYSSRFASVFIQTDKQVYNKASWISFRIYGIHPNMQPIETGSVEIFVKDSLQRTVRRWLGKQLLNGYAEDKVYVSSPPKTGTWTIEVHGFGDVFTHTVLVEDFFATRYDVNVTVPGVLLDSEYALQGTVMANFTANYMPVEGNMTLIVEIQAPTERRKKRYSTWIEAPIDSIHPLLIEKREHFKGTAGFSFPLDEVRRHVQGSLVGTTLHVYATVTDWFYGQGKTNRAVCVIKSSIMNLRFLGGPVRVFKPQAPFNVYIAVQAENGQQLPWKHRRQLRITKTIQTTSGVIQTFPDDMRLVPDDSVVRYSLLPDSHAHFITIRVSFDGLDSQWQELTAYRHYTYSNHYLTVTSSTLNPAADTYMVFTVRTTVYVAEIYYQILSKGDIVSASVLYMRSQQRTFSVALSRAMAPSARLVVHCVLGTGEVLADSLHFRVRGVRNQGVKLNVNQGKDFSEDTFEVNSMADPSTLITFAAAGRDLYQKGAWGFLTEQQIEDDLLTYDGHANGSFKHTWWTEFLRGENVYYTANSFAVDANTTFTYAGMLAFTDGMLRRPPLYLSCNASLGDLPCMDGTCYRVEQVCDSVRNCQDGADEMGCDEGQFDPPELFSQMARIKAHYDSNDWMWQALYTKPSGRLDLQIEAPERPAVWMIQAVTLSPTNGIAFNEVPYVFDVTRPFYMRFETPPSVFRGEQLGIEIALHNFWNQPLETVLTIADSDDFRFVHVDEGGIVSSYLPRTSRGHHQVFVYLKAGEQRLVHFPIVPVKIGKIEITVEHYNFLSSSTVTRTTSVSYDGVTNQYHTPYLIDLINSGSIIIPDLKIPIPERFLEPGERFHLYVPGSETATISVVGDVVGPGITGSNMAAWTMFGQLSGQGDGYIFDFAVDLYWLKFLKRSDQLGESRLVESLHGLNSDLTIVYTFLRDDYSFAMFRKRSESNIWLTSFGLQVLSDAVVAEWDHILFIDIDILNKIALWICAQQDKATGSWGEVRHWYDHKMTDPANMADSEGRPLNLSLTAYTSAALSKARRVLTGDAASMARSSVTLAAAYLASHLNAIWEPFQLCITAYALHLANHNAMSDAFDKVWRARRIGRYIYWSAEEVPENPFTVINTITELEPRQDYPHETRAVQATGYALMLHIWNNNVTIPIMKWLQTMRNVDGAFGSTQDTVVALQALSEFGYQDTNRGLYTMGVNLFATHSQHFYEQIVLSKGDFIDYHQVAVPAAYGNVRASAQGTGYALLQMTSTVNVEYPWLIYPQPVRPIFDLWIPAITFSGRNSSRFDMRVCTRWLDTARSPRSGFTMLEVDIPSGFVVTKQDLKAAEKLGPYDIWKRSRFSKQKVLLLLDYITPEETCFGFHGFRWYPIANSSIQHKIRIYEWHAPANHNTTLYTTYSLFHNHICLVCGSYQCPYCPYYNTAPRAASSTLLLLTVLLGMLLLPSLQHLLCFQSRHS